MHLPAGVSCIDDDTRRIPGAEPGYAGPDDIHGEPGAIRRCPFWCHHLRFLIITFLPSFSSSLLLGYRKRANLNTSTNAGLIETMVETVHVKNSKRRPTRTDEETFLSVVAERGYLSGASTGGATWLQQTQAVARMMFVHTAAARIPAVCISGDERGEWVGRNRKVNEPSWVITKLTFRAHWKLGPALERCAVYLQAAARHAPPSAPSSPAAQTARSGSRVH